VPVLLQESLEALDIAPDDTVVDATLGGAGHARAFADRLGPNGTLVGFDVDDAAIARAEDALADVAPRVVLIRGNFRTMAESLRERGITPTKIFFDLGWSSFQLTGKGMSFLVDEPLDMRFGDGAITARAVVNAWEESSLADVIYGFGGERFARRIAKGIAAARLIRPIETTTELADIVRESVPAIARRGPIHPATKTFQALRIAVNDELGSLEQGLAGAWESLRSGGRLAVISFHSLEDRIVKTRFLSWEHLGSGTRLTKKPIAPARAESLRNRRARSAKLRSIQKT
jgi:16S rRNA (cytosine1402-N4)-methyltransferase